MVLPVLRSMHRRHGQVALVHFDAHLDTWDTYFGAPYTHGTLLRRASEEGLFRDDSSMHVGIRGPLYSSQDIVDDAGSASARSAPRTSTEGVEGVVEWIRERVGTIRSTSRSTSTRSTQPMRRNRDARDRRADFA